MKKMRIRQMLNLLSRAEQRAQAWRVQGRSTKEWDGFDKAYQAIQYWKKAEVRLGQRLVEFGSDYIFEGHYVVEHKAALYR